MQILTSLIMTMAAALVSGGEPAAAPATNETSPGSASEKSGSAESDLARKERLDFFVPRLKELRLHYSEEPKRPITLHETPLFSFDNPVSFISDGLMFVWTDRGRPVVAMKSYYNGPPKSWGRTFVVLGERALVLESGQQPLWTPPEAATHFARLDGAPRPADRPNLRLTQMRQFAERFHVIDNWGMRNPTDWQLRLLTTPLLRYEVPDENVIDAALFGYVLTSSPEALVLLEARRSGGELSWHYAVSRFTRFGITFSLDDRKLAEFPRLDEWPPTGTYFHNPLPMPEYPFKTGKNTPDAGK